MTCWARRTTTRAVAATFALCVLCTASAQAAEEFNLAPGSNLVFKDAPFSNNSAEPTAAFAATLERLAAYLKQRPELCIEIGGHADNRGKAEANQKLSQARANAVRLRLLAAHALPSDCLIAKGYGSSRPVDNSDSEEAHAKNRRLEIVVLESRSRVLTTNPQAEIIHHAAELTVVIQDVRTQAPWQLEQVRARKNDKLFELHRVSTQPNSRAEVSFADRSKLQIGENALVIIYGSTLGAGGTQHTDDIKLLRGGLFAKLQEIRKEDQRKESLQVSTDAATVTMNPGVATLFVDDKAAEPKANGDKKAIARTRAVLSVYRGKSTIAGSGKQVDVSGGFGTQVEQGEPPEPPRPLPLPPEWLHPSEPIITLNEQSDATFWFQSTTRRTKLEVARDEDFNDLVCVGMISNALAGTQQHACGLEPGTYYVALTAYDDTDLQSPPEVPARQVEVKAPAPAAVKAAREQQPAASPAPITRSPVPALPIAENEEQPVLRLGVAMTPALPLGFSTERVSLAMALQLGWVATRWVMPVLRLGAGFMAGGTIVQPHFSVDAGVVVEWPVTFALRPYAELDVGVFGFTERRFPEVAEGRSKVSFAPALGLGGRYALSHGSLSAGVHYRVLVDGLSATLPTNRVHGLLELRLSLAYQ